MESPISAAALALGAGARFIARSVDTLQKHMPGVLVRAHAHNGTSFVEIFQNCLVFNDNVFGEFTNREVAADRQLHLEHGKPMLFGSEGNRAIRIKPGALALEAVTVGENGVTADDVLVHDETDRPLAQMLAAMEPPEMPVALGVLYCDPAPSYGQQVARSSTANAEAPNLDELLRRGQTWTVGARE